jgi:hypothetical protein
MIPRTWRYERDKPDGKWALWSRVWGPMVTVQCAGGDLDGVEPDMLLIAAAPDLLEALERVMGWVKNWSPEFTEDDEWGEDEEFILTAIRKARGEE